MTFYAEHSVDEAIKLLKDEAKARQAAEKGTSKTTRAVSSKKIVAKQQSKPAVINMPTTAVNAALAEAKTKELLKDRKKRLVNELVAQGADRKVASAMVDAFRTSGVEHMITATTKQSNKKTVATTAAAQPAPTAEQPAAKRRVYKNMPNNYSIVKGSVAQEDGTILIHNGKPLFKQNKDGVKEQVKDSRGKPAHKVAALIVDPQAFNEAQKKSRVGEIHRGNTKYIDKEPKPQRNYAVVKDKDGKVTVAKVKSIKEFDENGKNADPHLVEIDHKKYGLENRSGVDHETFSQNKMSHKPLRLEDKKVFPEQEPRAKLSSKDTHRVLEHIKQNKKKK